MNDLLRFILKRTVTTAFVLMAIIVLIFLITHMMPGDAVDIMLGGIATQSLGDNTIADLRHSLGLDLPLYQQLFNWLWALSQGDMGTSYVFDTPIAPLIAERLQNSLLLAVPAALMMIIFGLTSGVISAVKKDSWVDHSISFFNLVMLSIPPFLVGALFIYIFSVQLHWIPAAFNAIDMDDMSFWTKLTTYSSILIFPSLTMAFGSIAYVSRQTRASMIEELKNNYVRTAVLKGVSPRNVIIRHALRNGLLPAITVIAFNIGQIIAGTIIIEVVFSYPGIGDLMILALKYRDIPLILATMVVVSAAYVLANLIADILYTQLNPKIAY